MSAIRQIKVEGFQSLDPVSLDLAAFTVVVGPSSSGKSALVRALKYAFFFGRGSGFITQGKTKAGVGILTDEAAVVLTKSDRKSSYVISDGTDSKSYTKLGTTVPEAVQDVLRGSDLNFAGQFDRPFWFDESGASVARDLGELTNVTMVYEAAREANRRRLAVSASVKAYREQVERVESQLASFDGLEEREAEYARLRELFDTVVAATTRAQGIQRTLERISSLEAQLQDVRARLAAQSPPSPVPAAEAVVTYQGLAQFLATLGGLRKRQLVVLAQIDQHCQALAQAVVQRDALAEELGARCQTCGALPEHQHPELIGQT